MSTITDQVSTKAPAAFWAVLKKYWAFGVLAILGLAVLFMAKKDAIVQAFTTKGSATRGDKLPAFLRRWLGVTTTAAVFCFVVFGAIDAHAACCAAGGAASGALSTVSSIVGEHWWALGGLIPAAIGLTQLGAPDVLDCKEQDGGDSLTVAANQTVDTSRSMYLRSSEYKVDGRGRPLVATGLTVEMTTELTMTAGDSSVYDDDLARLFAYLAITSPRMGALTTPEMHTGPVVDLVERFISEGFERSGDCPVDTIAAPSADTESTTIIKYLTRPFIQRWLRRPLRTCPWLPLLHDTNIQIGVAKDTCLAAVSTNSDVSGTRVLKASVAYQPSPWWFYPLIPYSRVDKPSSGSNGLTFRGFGEEGPKCTQKTDYVHTLGHLSNLKGLPGNLTFDSVTHLYGADFGMPDVANIAHLVKERVRAQYSGNVFGVNYTDSGNYPRGTTNSGGGMQLAKLLFLLLIQPQVGADEKQLEQMVSGKTKSIRYTTSSTRTGEDAFYMGSLRKVSPSVINEWRAIEGSRLPASIDVARPFNK
jgi:hypothetical protein